MTRLRVVFDLDDTLYPERDFAISGFEAAGRWAERTLGVEGLAADMTRLLDEGHLGALFKIALAARMPDHTDEHLDGLRRAYRHNEPELVLFEDAHGALEHFAASGPIGLITDGTLVMQQSKVRALGIGPRFREIVYTDALGPDRTYFKPHPMAYERMETALGAPGDRFVYVGDNPSKDFVAPNARGWTTVWIDRPGRIHAAAKVASGGAPHHKIASLGELAALLGA